jgi:hypothetical protein
VYTALCNRTLLCVACLVHVTQPFEVKGWDDWYAVLFAAVQGVLRRIISRRMVEPQRRFYDLHRMYMNKHIARVSAGNRIIAATALHLKHL